jgi:hypothetical protein
VPSSTERTAGTLPAWHGHLIIGALWGRSMDTKLRAYLSIDDLAERWGKNRKLIIEEIVFGGLNPSFFADDIECYQHGKSINDTVFLSGEFSFNPPHRMIAHEDFTIEAAQYLGDRVTGGDSQSLSSKNNVLLFVEPVNLTISEIMIPTHPIIQAYDRLFEIEGLEPAQPANQTSTEIKRLQRTVAALALGLAAKPGTYNKAGKPNVSQLAKLATEHLRDATSDRTPHGFSETTVRQTIAAALKACPELRG